MCVGKNEVIANEPEGHDVATLRGSHLLDLG
jgi:hypothetical protein